MKTEEEPSSNDAVEALRNSMTQKRASLTSAEQFFLQALLLDDGSMTNHEECVETANKKLNDDILFSLPFERKEANAQQAAAPPAPRRPLHNFIGLWSAFEDGVRPKALLREHEKKKEEENKKEDDKPEEKKEDEDEDDAESVRSDVEVRHDDKDDQSENSSWGEDDCAPEHYDAWEVLKDEYARDFGFDYKLDHVITMEELDDGNHYFKILGTTANDKAAQPHVLSPPLMDSLMTFLPDVISNQNYWLKYSLVRDGASLDTLRRYVRAAPRTILAIETTNGQVFGSFTSSSWRNEKHYYGSGESFLWRMRHNRNGKCTSLFEQAQMESEIDMYPYSNANDMIQLCNYDRIAVGGGELVSEKEIDVEARSERFGFGLSISYDMLTGTSSPCATFRNPCLADGGGKGQNFEIVNLELWTLTPAFTVDSAEKLEMSQFFVKEHSSGRSARSPQKKSSHSIDDLRDTEDYHQDKFYRRVGENDESAQQREIWQYAKMMDTTTKK